jgi:hypothetical protein
MRFWIALVMMTLAGLAQAEIKTQTLNYQAADGSKLVGFYAYDDAIKRPAPRCAGGA